MADPLVSIIVNNFNYARFLPRSIHSALAQTYSHVEVVVVDDCSTDESADVIRSFGTRVVPVLQTKNGGQGAAFNAGYRASRGEIVLFLDSDDYLLPTAVEKVVDAFTRASENREDVAKVQFRLNLVDNDGRFIDLYPAKRIRFDSGDVVPLLLQKGRYETPVTTGNAFSRRILDAVMPVPEEDFRICADGYLVTVVPLFGKVVSIDEPLGAYVQHGGNNWAGGGGNPQASARRFRRSLEHDKHRVAALVRWAERRGLRVSSDPSLHDDFHLSTRLASLCLEPDAHPVPSDSRLELGLRGSLAALQASSLSPKQKAIVSTWFVAAGVLPEAFAKRIVSWRLVQESRPVLLDRWVKRARALVRGHRADR